MTRRRWRGPSQNFCARGDEERLATRQPKSRRSPLPASACSWVDAGFLLAARPRPVPQSQLSFNLNNQIAGAPSSCTAANVYCYDNAGNLLNDGQNTYTYDAEGRIKSINNGAVQYVYDAEGNRVAKLNSSGTVTSVYILNAANQQITELNSSGTWQHSNIYAPGGRLLATYDAPGQSSPGYHYNLTDWLGTKRMQTTSGGNQQETCLSNPFGDGLTCTGGTDATEQHFTGKDRDVESGLDYFYARYYSSNLGRFMTPDWAGKPTAVPYANFGDPQSLNLYAYVRNNPNTGIDVDGHYLLGQQWGPAGPQWYDPIEQVNTNYNMPGGNPDQNQPGATQTSGSGSAPPPPTPPGDSGSAQQQNAGASPSSGGTSRTVTLNIGGKKVTVAYSYGNIFSNYGGGVDITATPQNCSGCAWAQVYSRGSGAKKDGDGIGPLYGDEGGGLSVFYDTPASSSPGKFTATTILGATNISGKSFTAIGGFTYGYSMNANGGVTMMAPRVATPQQMSGAIQVLQNNSPDWTIH